MDKIDNNIFDATLKTNESYREIPLKLNERIKERLLKHKKYKKQKGTLKMLM